MSRAVRRIVPIVLLLAVAGVCGYAAYNAFADRPPSTSGWARAAAVARQAERTRAQLPAFRMRQQAIELFTTLSGAGARSVRSRAAMVTGLLTLSSASADPAKEQNVLAMSADWLRQAVRLDRSNDDAAFDLELVLARAKASGRPIAQVPHRPRKHHGRPSTGKAGHGY